MEYTPEQRRECICKMVTIIAKQEGFEIDEEIVNLVLELGRGTTIARLEKWINLAELCIEAVEKALESYEQIQP